jgi:hypothetical protein
MIQPSALVRKTVSNIDENSTPTGLFSDPNRDDGSIMLGKIVDA